MITYKNITDVEVLENVPENAMALVNDGGELKQVACSGFGGNPAIAVINSQDGNFSCENMTYEEAVEAITTGKPFIVVIRERMENCY